LQQEFGGPKRCLKRKADLLDCILNRILALAHEMKVIARIVSPPSTSRVGMLQVRWLSGRASHFGALDAYSSTIEISESSLREKEWLTLTAYLHMSMFYRHLIGHGS
jgi:hypothetical protein